MGTKVNSNSYDISNDCEMIQDGFRDFSQYLVGLAFLVEPKSEDQPAQCYLNSGFVMQFGREWFWVTAGHIMEGIEECLKVGVAKQFRLIDSYGFGPDQSNVVPFNYEDAWRYHVYDKTNGLDFGAVKISAFYRRILESNSVAVVRKRDWRRLNASRFQNLVLAGLPEDTIERGRTFLDDHCIVHGKASPNLILAAQIPIPEESRLKHDRIAGKIDDNWSSGSIVGMSGGPVFGVRQNNNIFTRIIAVQSAWNERKRITFSCPITVFGPLLEKQIKDRK